VPGDLNPGLLLSGLEDVPGDLKPGLLLSGLEDVPGDLKPGEPPGAAPGLTVTPARQHCV